MKYSLFFENYFLLLFFLRACAGLYEDQIGKFEWRHQYVGKLKYSQFDVTSPLKKIIVATEQNVLAALGLKTGEVLWRQILESGENGIINLLAVDREILTVTGTSTPLIRGWELERGYLLWEWRIPQTPGDFVKWMCFKQKLLQLDFESASHIAVTVYHISSGKRVKHRIIPAAWLVPEKCVLQTGVIACISNDKLLYSVKIAEENDELKINIHHRSLFDLFQKEVSGGLRTTSGILPLVNLNVGGINQNVLLQPEIRVIRSMVNASQLFSSASVDQHTNIIASIAVENEVLNIVVKNPDGNIIPELSNSVPFSETHGNPEFASLFCQPRKDKGTACRLLISTSHDVMILIQHPGKILWTREESLSSILTVLMISLPVSDTDAAIEKEFDNKNLLPGFGVPGGFLGMFFRRVASQYLQVQNSLLMLLGGLNGGLKVGESSPMTQDEFGLHKLIVAATRTGKIYGIDNHSGNIVWQVKLENVEPFSTGTVADAMPLFLLRNARHHPLTPECVLLAKDKITKNTVLVSFNPIDGSLLSEEAPVRPLGIKIKQSLLLHRSDENFYRGILLLDENNRVHVYPESAESVVSANPSSIFVFTADAASGTLEGFALFANADGKIVASKTWQICLASTIVSVVGKNREEKVHSQGRVLGDRSVLYKYVNPNLIAVVTRAQHPSYKTIINLHLIDAVSGTIVYSSSHRRVKEPIHVVHSENWVIYTYINEKYRRTELAALEMYEGKTQSNATVFSSVDSGVLLPIVERQAYILPANVLSLKETITEKGITSKHILVALSTGGILELPWAYADPRRPVTVTPELREEGVIPYMPELPTPLEAIINHNQTVKNVRGMHTSSSGLESTCLVFVYGLDTFYTRVAPSKTFDLLKDDFDYSLIALVLIALSTVSYVTKRLASRKALKQAWK